MTKLIPIILSDGRGTRLWPVSRPGLPKAFMRPTVGGCLLQQTLERAIQLQGVKRVVTVTCHAYLDMTRDAYGTCSVPRGVLFDYILEPVSRNTAPAVLMAAPMILMYILL